MFAFIFSFVVGLSFLSFLIPRLRILSLDKPNFRSSHSQPTPRGGGLVFVVVSVFSCLISLFSGHVSSLSFLPLVSAPLAIVGFIDDRQTLPAAWRYCVQVMTALPVIALSPIASPLYFAVSHSPLFLFFLSLIVISVTAIINFTNFMDGLDGLVSGCMFVVIFSLSLSQNAPWSLWTLVGSLLGFLIFNWCPAKVFMGDVGSTFLGAVFAGLCSRRQVGLMLLVTYLSQLPYLQMLAYAFHVVFSLVSVFFNPIVYICSNVSIRLAGHIREFPLPISW